MSEGSQRKRAEQNDRSYPCLNNLTGENFRSIAHYHGLKEIVNLFLLNKKIICEIDCNLFWKYYFKNPEDRVLLTTSCVLTRAKNGIRADGYPLILVETLIDFKCEMICIRNDLVLNGNASGPISREPILKLFDVRKLGKVLRDNGLEHSHQVRDWLRDHKFKKDVDFYQFHAPSMGLREVGVSTNFYLNRETAIIYLLYYSESLDEITNKQLRIKTIEIEKLRKRIEEMELKISGLDERINELERCCLSMGEIKSFVEPIYKEIDEKSNLFCEVSMYLKRIQERLDNDHPLITKTMNAFFVNKRLTAIKLIESLAYHINPNRYNLPSKINSFLYHVHGNVRIVKNLHDLGHASSHQMYYSLSQRALELHEQILNYVLDHYEKLGVFRVADNHNLDEDFGFLKRKSYECLIDMLKLLSFEPDDNRQRFTLRNPNLPPLYSDVWCDDVNRYIEEVTRIYEDKNWMLFDEEMDIEVDVEKFHNSFSLENIYPLGLSENNCKNPKETLMKMIEFYVKLKKRNRLCLSLICRESGDSDFHKFRSQLINAAWELYNMGDMRMYRIDVNVCSFTLNSILTIDKHHLIDSFFESCIAMSKSKSKKHPPTPEKTKKNKKKGRRKEDKRSCGRLMEVLNFMHENITDRYNISSSLERRFSNDFDMLLGIKEAAETYKDEYMKLMNITREQLREKKEIRTKNMRQFVVDNLAEFKSMAYFLFEQVPCMVTLIPKLLSGDFDKTVRALVRLEFCLVGANNINYMKHNLWEIHHILRISGVDKELGNDLVNELVSLNSMVAELLNRLVSSQTKDNQLKTEGIVNRILKNVIHAGNGKMMWKFHGYYNTGAYDIDERFKAKPNYKDHAHKAIKKWIRNRKTNLTNMTLYNKRNPRNRKDIVVFFTGRKQAVVPVFRKPRNKTPEFIENHIFKSTFYPDYMLHVCSVDFFKGLLGQYNSSYKPHFEDVYIPYLRHLSSIEYIPHEIVRMESLGNFFCRKNPGGSSKKGKTYSGNPHRNAFIENVVELLKKNEDFEVTEDQANAWKHQWNISDLTQIQMRDIVDYQKKKIDDSEREYIYPGDGMDLSDE